jgi:PAS domain S-box-containing protein
VVLFVPVVLTLWLIPNAGVQESLAFVALRSAAYIAVASVAVGFSRYRWDSERRLEGLLALFDSLKTPIVVSDIDGNINFANKACCDLLGRGADELKAANFFNVFSGPAQRGQSIERYLKLFDKEMDPNLSVTVSIRKAGAEAIRDANCLVMAWDKQRLLVTQL